jgi:hypothetical protein
MGSWRLGLGLTLALVLAHDLPGVSAGSREWGPKRFELLDGVASEVVRDKDTGLIWERAPESPILDWRGALAHCYRRETGGRLGWRLPTVEELGRLVAPAEPVAPKLPPGHPFEGVQALAGPVYDRYWSATTDVDPEFAWHVTFGNGTVGRSRKNGIAAVSLFYAWCVRDGGSR